MFTCVAKQLFPYNIYPSQSDLKDALKQCLEERYPEFMHSLSSNQYTNRFHSEWFSPVCIDIYRFLKYISFNYDLFTNFYNSFCKK